MSAAKPLYIISVVCLLAGCASMPTVTPLPTADVPSSTSTPVTLPATRTPTTISIPSPIFAQPQTQLQCGASINKMVYSPNGTFLATVSNKDIYVCNTKTLTLQHTLSFEQSITGGIAWTSDSARLATGLLDGTVWVWHESTGEKKLIFDAGGETVVGVSWSADSNELLVVSREDYDLHVWDTSTGKKLSIALNYDGFETVWSPDGKQFAIGCACDRTYVWSAETGQSLLSFKTPAPAYYGMAWSPDGTRFVGEFGDAVVYDAKTAEELFSLDALVMAWSPDGKWLAGVSAGSIHVWAASTGDDMAVIGSSNRVVSLAWSPDGKQLASVNNDGLVSLWDVEDLALSFTPAPKADLSGNGPWYVFTASSILYGSRYLWAVNAVDGTELTKLVHEPVLDFAVRPTESGENSATIAYVAHSQISGESTLRMVRLPHTEGETITTSGGNLAWSPDGHKLAFDHPEDDGSSSIDVYDIDTKTIHHAARGEGNVLEIRWSPDGRYIVYERYSVSGMGGPLLSGVWAERADGSREIPLIELSDDVTFIDYQWFKGWLSPVEILLGDSDEGGLRAANLETGEITLIYDGGFFEAVFAKEHDTWLLTRGYSPEADTPLILIRHGAKSAIPGKMIARIRWSEAHGLFFGLTEKGDLYTISPLGQVTETSLSAEYLYEYVAVESPDGTLWAWRPLYAGADQPVWIGEAMSNLLWKVPAVSDITWSPDSRRLMLLCADGLWVAERPDFEPVQIVKDVYAAYDYWSWRTWEGAWIP